MESSLRPVAAKPQTKGGVRSASVGKAILTTWRLTLALSVLVFGVLGATAAWSVVGLMRLDEAREAAEQSAASYAALRSVGSETLNAETGERGFLLTGKATYLAPYYSAISRIRESMAGLGTEQGAWSKGNQAKVAAVAAAVAHELEVLDKAVRGRIDAPSQAGPTEASMDDGKSAMDAVRVAIVELGASESMGAQGSAVERDRQVQENYWTFGLGSALNMALVAMMVQGLRQAIRKSMAAHEDQARLLRSAAAGLKQVDGLSELGRLLQSCQGMAEAEQLLRLHLPPLMRAGSGALYLLGERKDHLGKAFQWGDAASFCEGFEPNECWAVRLGQPFRQRQSASACPHLGEELPEGADVRCLPLVAHGELLGLLVLEAGEPEDAQEGAEYEGYRRIAVEQVGLAIGNMKLRESLRQQSIRDGLTGLHNRRFVEEAAGLEISRARRLPKEASGHGIAVMMIDIDNFKSFNDRHGHKVGDLVLCEVAHAMMRCARGTDIVARYGGEEFAVVLPDMPADMAAARAEQVRVEVEGMASQAVGRGIGPVTISIGLARFPEHGSTLDELLLAADGALYEAKEGGRNCVREAPCGSAAPAHGEVAELKCGNA